jgi:hypothetical protein
VGLLQARRERKRGFQVPGVVAEDVVGELESKCVTQPVSCCVVLCFRVPSSVSVPCGRGVRPPFIDQGESESHACRAISYVRECDVLCGRVGGCPDDPCSDPAIMAYLVPEQWRPRG